MIDVGQWDASGQARFEADYPPTLSYRTPCGWHLLYRSGGQHYRQLNGCRLDFYSLKWTCGPPAPAIMILHDAAAWVRALRDEPTVRSMPSGTSRAAGRTMRRQPPCHPSIRAAAAPNPNRPTAFAIGQSELTN